MFYKNINKFNSLSLKLLLPLTLLGFLNSAAFGIDCFSLSDVCQSVPNLLPQNIKKGVTILGVVGTFSGETTHEPSSHSASDRYKSVPHLLPQNIRKGVTILGVVGTFSGETTHEPSSHSASDICQFPNLHPQNIRTGVTILGIVGTFEYLSNCTSSNCDNNDKKNGSIFSSLNCCEFNCCKFNCCSNQNPRYRNNRNGTVKDMCTGLIWLKNANCFGTVKWEAAKEKVAYLASEQYWKEEAKKKIAYLAKQSGKTVKEKADEADEADKLEIPQCDLTDESEKGEWRLPTIEEWNHMVDKRYSWPGPSLSNAAVTGQWTKDDAFLNVQTNLYWSSTTYEKLSSAAWCMYLGRGSTNYYFKGGTYYVWPVREEKEEEKENYDF